MFNASLAKGITAQDTAGWNRKLSPADTLSLSSRIDAKLSSYAEGDPVFNASLAKGITAQDTAGWNRKLSPGDTLSLSSRIDAKLSSYAEADPVFNASLAKGITAQDTAAWNRKLVPGDTVSLSQRIEAKLGLPPSGNTPGNILYWNGTSWVRLPPGLPGQQLSLSPQGEPVWTGATFPTVTTLPIGSVTHEFVVGTPVYQAVVGANITSDGGGPLLGKGVVCGTDDHPTIQNALKNVQGTGFQIGIVSGVLTGLSAGTTYTCRAYAFNTSGTIYGEQVSFTTDPQGSIAGIDCTGATFSAELVAGQSANGIILTLPYTGGNGGVHNGQVLVSTGVTDLTATLSPGKFITGTGSLSYSISGIPPGPGTANFTLNIGGQSCLLTVEVGLFTMKNIPAGTFSMGCTPGDPDCVSNETPVRMVTLSAFQIGETEVNQAHWQAVMGNNPSSFSSCAQCPVEQVSWYDALVFCNRLSEANGLPPCYYADAGFTQVYGKSGDTWSLPNSGQVYWNPSAKGYRLPTEAEWEYAARGGSATNIYSGSNNVEEVAWYSLNSTKPVKGKLPNGYGLYDMSGNVNEWVWDWYQNYPSSSDSNPTGPASGSSRISRGGSTSCGSHCSRVARRDITPPDIIRDWLGFRLARTP